MMTYKMAWTEINGAEKVIQYVNASSKEEAMAKLEKMAANANDLADKCFLLHKVTDLRFV